MLKAFNAAVSGTRARFSRQFPFTTFTQTRRALRSARRCRAKVAGSGDAAVSVSLPFLFIFFARFPGARLSALA